MWVWSLRPGLGPKVFLPTPWTRALKWDLKYPYAKMASPDKLPQQFPSSLRSEVSRVALAFCTDVQRLHTTQLGLYVKKDQKIKDFNSLQNE